MSAPAAAKRIDDIELLRAFAVLMVLLEHAHGNLITWPGAAFDLFNRHFNGGAGVDLFFAISGFVIARDLLPKLAASATRADFFNVSVAFWIRRAWRILPSAWLWLAVILAATLFFNHSGAFRSFDATAAGTIAALMQFYNVHFSNCFMSYDCGTNSVYWSLSLEEQFYLALPLVAFLCRGRLALLQILLIVLVVLQLVSQRSLLLVMFRTDALLLGVLIAIQSAKAGYQRCEPRFLSTLGNTRLPLTLVLVAAVASTASSEWLLAPYRFGIVALIAALLVWLASFDRDYLMAPTIGKRMLLWVGSRSYAIYLIHVPAYLATREFWFRVAPQGTILDASWTLTFVLTATVLTGVLAEFNYHLIETPLRRKGVVIAARFVARRMPLPAGQG